MKHMNPERAAMNNLDRRNRGDDIKSTTDRVLSKHEAYSKALEAGAFKRDDFEDLYGPETLKRDAEYVKKRQAQFAAEAHEAGPNGLTKGEISKLAEILEFEVIAGINRGEWFTEYADCIAQKTNAYDDIANGVDLVLQYRNFNELLEREQTGEKDVNDNPYKYLGMAVDVSFSHNLQKKFERIKHEIDIYDGDKNRLGKVKYFKSDKIGLRGEISGLPRVVAALDIGIIEDLSKVERIARLYPERKKELKDHTARHELIIQLEKQLVTFADYAQKLKKTKCYDDITRALNTVTLIRKLSKSEQKLDESEYKKNDKVHTAIERGLAIFR